MSKIAELHMPRRKMSAMTLVLGALFGFANIHLPVRFDAGLPLLAWTALSLLLVVALHEATHAGVARLFGHHALLGLKPPLVYVSFTVKIPRRDFLYIALAPLVFLNILFAAVYYCAGSVHPWPTLHLIALLSFEINTLGAAGDMWMALSLCRYPADVLVEDTKNGFNVWSQS
jgi:hypothetical protein